MTFDGYPEGLDFPVNAVCCPVELGPFDIAEYRGVRVAASHDIRTDCRANTEGDSCGDVTSARSLRTPLIVDEVYRDVMYTENRDDAESGGYVYFDARLCDVVGQSLRQEAWGIAYSIRRVRVQV